MSETLNRLLSSCLTIGIVIGIFFSVLLIIGAGILILNTISVGI